MHKFPPLFWLAVFCAVLSAGLWVWSSWLPDANWESSTMAAVPSPSPSTAIAAAPSATPVPEPVATPTETSSSVAEVTPAQSSAPDATPEVVPVASPSPSPNATVAVVPTPVPAPSAAPSLSDAELAGPMPVRSVEDTIQAPQPTPVPLTVADIARQPKLWPRQLFLLTAVRFPVVLNGVNVGNVQVPAGSAVVLHKVNTEGTVEVELRGASATVKAEATDLIARARTLAATPPAIVP